MDEMIFQMSQDAVLSVIAEMATIPGNMEIELACHFHHWLIGKCNTSLDPWFHLMCNFVRIGKRIPLPEGINQIWFKHSYEMCPSQFLSVWTKINKFKCVELTLGSMEDMYYNVETAL